ncbi:sugar nucleotide-binding protein [Candidatus Microgenomates bacterium]|nr:sugar nucleotide-binding protein [Candidatus Microgenomates bacterium]
MTKVLVLGASGLVGSKFVEASTYKDNILKPSHRDLDLSNKDSVRAYLAKEKPEIVINFAAFTDVTAAERERDDKNGSCWQFNYDGVVNLLESLDPAKTKFIQISTHMVFSGLATDPGPYAEDHPVETDPQKLNWYGVAKAEAEKAIQKRLGTQATIVRLVNPVRAKFAKKLDYLRKPLQLFDQGKLYPLFSDQQVSLTDIDETTLTLDKIIDQNASGVFHCSSRDTVIFSELIKYLLLKARGYAGELKTWSFDDYATNGANKVRYPKFSGLKVEKTEKTLGLKFRTWQEIIDKLVAQGITV